MALDFGKLNFSVSFNPTSAFPLDARSYFESLSAAQAAAAQAKEAGSTESVYYYGQTLVVVENNAATFYIIQPNNTLAPVGGSSTEIQVDTSVFEYDEEGNLSLKGFNEAELNAILSKNSDGSLSWIAPIDAYTKQETDEKIASAVANAAHLKRKIVASVEEIQTYVSENEDEEQYIFMVPTGLEQEDDKYDEYMVVTVTDEEGIETQLIEKVGSWEVDLTGYAKLTEVQGLLDGKVDKAEGSRLMTETEGNKLAGIEEGAQVNIIESISTDFTILEEGKQLTLNPIAIDKITGLQDILNDKVDVQEGYTLLSPTDKAKLDALVLGDSGGVEISGKVNADNVEGLDEWIAERADVQPGLSENNLTDELYNKLNDSLFITSVDTSQLQVSSGQLSIIAVDSSKVTGLEEALNAKANTSELEPLVTSIENISTQLNNYVLKTDYDEEIANIWDALSWKNI